MSQLGLHMSTEEDDKPRVRRRRLRSGIAVLVALVVLVGGGAFAWGTVSGLTSKFSFGQSAADYTGSGSGTTQIKIDPGESASAIGRSLKSAGVVKSVEAFVEAARADDRSSKIQPGTYRLKQQLPAADALAALLDDKNRVVSRITLREGIRLADALTLIASKTDFSLDELKAIAKDPKGLGLPPYAKSLEGYLFPATYEVEPGDTAKGLIKQMVAKFNDVAAKVKINSSDHSPAEIVKIASLLEAEAARSQDYAKVARVLENRLAKGMPLQLDSTVHYALNKSKALTLDDLKSQSPYNTYTHKGLPPTPIDNPGEGALRAALNPADGDWIYFVTTDPKTGETKFTDNYDEFLKFKRELKANS